MGWLKFTFGEKILLIYFVTFYFVPIIADWLIDLRVKYYLVGGQDFTRAFLFALVYLIVILFLRKLRADRDVTGYRPRVRRKKGNRSRLKFLFAPVTVNVIIFSFLAISYQFAQEFETSFRHTASYSASGLIPVLTFALKTIATIYVFCSTSNKNLIYLAPLSIFAYMAAIYFSFVGSYDIIYGFIALYALIKNSGASLLRIARKIFSKFGAIAIVAIVPAVVFAGMWNKIGFDEAVTYFSSGGLMTAVELFLNRLFYHSYSLAYQLGDIKRSLALGWQAVDIVSFQSSRRFLVLMGESVSNETLQTVSRLNYLEISGYRVGGDAGASPGLLGSIFYLPGSVFMLPLHMLYVLFIVRIFDNVMGAHPYQPPAYLGGLVIFQVLVDSIADNLNPFSIGFIALVAFFVLSLQAKHVPDLPTKALRHHDWN
ncbi:hypothetical protein [Qipengyuania huizhouensis]|uniref:hypothetical protein n=1 Tax=Qipengyuania huizhouensis TaxID=2867245 RepID=UPI001C878D08|nr:hypothetical protein [Qipengyuania huizhouensis]